MPHQHRHDQTQGQHPHGQHPHGHEAHGHEAYGHDAHGHEAHGHRGHARHARDGDLLIHHARAYDLLLWVWGRRGRRWRGDLADRLDLGPGQRALDVACGTGDLVLELARRVRPDGEAVGVDAAPEMVARAGAKAARAGLPASFREARAQQLPFPDAAFDAVSCTLALHHVAAGERSAAIAEMRRVLKPGGRLLIADLQEPRGRWAWLARRRFGHHLAERPLDQAEELARTAGFDDVRRGATRAGWIGMVTARA